MSSSASVIYTLDPDADTVIVLRNPILDFAPWREPQESRSGSNRIPNVEKRQGLIPSIKHQPATGYSPYQSLVGDEQDAINDYKHDAEQRRSGSVLKTVELDEISHRSVPETDDAKVSKETQFYVSSRHLILASPKFRTMLSRGAWLEGIRDNFDNRFYIDVEEWDEEALLILLNILHLRNREVPRYLSLEMLCKMAILVDYYDCLEAIEPFSHIWVNNLKNHAAVPTVYNRDLVMWVCVGFHFEVPDTFSQTTSVAIRMIRDDFSTLGLPIWPTVADAIELRRQAELERMVDMLFSLCDYFGSYKYRCPLVPSISTKCGAVLAQALSKGMKSLDILASGNDVPFEGMNIEEVLKKVAVLRSPIWYDSDRAREPHKCSLWLTITNEAARFEKEIRGLRLRDFKKDDLKAFEARIATMSMSRMFG